MLLNHFNDDGKGILEEKDHTVEVELWTQQIEEHVLAVALVEF